jgi:hypothetical protein
MLQPGHLSHCSIGVCHTAASELVTLQHRSLSHCSIGVRRTDLLFLSLIPIFFLSFTFSIPIFYSSRSLYPLSVLRTSSPLSYFSCPYFTSSHIFQFSLLLSFVILFRLFLFFASFSLIVFSPFNVLTRTDIELCFYSLVLLPGTCGACSDETRSRDILMELVQTVKVSLQAEIDIPLIRRHWIPWVMILWAAGTIKLRHCATVRGDIHRRPLWLLFA